MLGKLIELCLEKVAIAPVLMLWLGYGIASQLYGPTTYNKADFGDAVGSLECAASTTPIGDALVMNTDLLSEEAFTEHSRSHFTGPYRVEMLDGGHFVHRENPDEFLALLLGFLAEGA